MNNDKENISESTPFIPDEKYYKSEEYLKEHEKAFKKQKTEFQNFLPVEFFHWAGMENSGDRGILSIILEDHPEYINIQNRNNETALMVAARLNLVDNLKVLLEAPGVDISYTNENGNFVMYAATYRSRNVLNYILDNHKDKIDYNCRSIIGDTIFHLTARQAYSRFWEDIDKDIIGQYKYNENQAGNNCLSLAVEGYIQYKNHIALESVLQHFKKPDLYAPNKFGETIIDKIKYTERDLIIRKKSADFLAPMKLLLGID